MKTDADADVDTDAEVLSAGTEMDASGPACTCLSSLFSLLIVDIYVFFSDLYIHLCCFMLLCLLLQCFLHLESSSLPLQATSSRDSPEGHFRKPFIYSYGRWVGVLYHLLIPAFCFVLVFITQWGLVPFCLGLELVGGG